MRKFGLIGRHLPHSFSGRYFAQKFEREGIIDCSYSLYEMESIEGVEQLLSDTEMVGFNVTIPYKLEVMRYLTSLSEEAEAVGAVNCVKICGDEVVGYNTDIIGFEESLKRMLDGAAPAKALILGSGGASMAVEYVLGRLGIDFTVVSRRGGEGRYNYEQLTAEVIEEHKLIVNATPLGTFPDVDSAPPIDYSVVTANHYLYDLVYNPPMTKFLSLGEQRGATICNGEAMLIGQAEAAWRIWSL
ncbi:MAG: shikimate dehydrogenase [Rikenellaceae bacterium]